MDIPPNPPIIIAGDITPPLPPPGGNDQPSGPPQGSNPADTIIPPGDTIPTGGNPNPDQPLRVPEPSTFLMFASAMLATLFLRRRKATQEKITVRAVRGRRV